MLLLSIDYYSRDTPVARDTTPKERPRLQLQPRSTSTGSSSGSTKPSIFGDAKPRDEKAIEERLKAREAEKLAEKQALSKAKKLERTASATSQDMKQPRDNSFETRSTARRGRGERGPAGTGGRGRQDRVFVKKDTSTPKPVAPSAKVSYIIRNISNDSTESFHGYRIPRFLLLHLPRQRIYSRHLVVILILIRLLF